MAETVAVYSLGRVGVNVVDDPLVAEDGSFSYAQNAQTSPNEADGGLLKRSGMSKINLTDGPAAVLAILPIPFTDPG